MSGRLVPDEMVDMARAQALQLLRDMPGQRARLETCLGFVLAFATFTEASGMDPRQAADMMGKAFQALRERPRSMSKPIEV